MLRHFLSVLNFLNVNVHYVTSLDVEPGLQSAGRTNLNVGRLSRSSDQLRLLIAVVKRKLLFF